MKALSNPHRQEILELLAQGTFSVEKVAEEAEISVANASQHLQIMKRAQLLTTKRQGNFVYYTLANPKVYEAWKTLRDLGIEHIAELERTMHSFRKSRNSIEALTTDQLLDKMNRNEVTVLDVRPKTEYAEGHISGALNIPVEQLSERLSELPQDREIVAYCRGPFCVFADEAVRLLNEHGFRAHRLEDGFPEWKLDELPTS